MLTRRFQLNETDQQGLAYEDYGQANDRRLRQRHAGGADRHLDGHVKRTRERPLATGRISEKEAKILFASLVVLAFVLVCLTNLATVLLSFVGVALAAIYPFMKRYTHLPQVVLGMAFSWSIPMAFMAVSREVPLDAWLLLVANVAWTVAYDTQYAMVDRDDDIKIGIKSTARLFGRWDKRIIGLLQLLTLALLAATGNFEEIPMHIRATAQTGASPRDVREAFQHVAIYAGVPRANHALKLARDTYAQMDARQGEVSE